MDLINCSQQKRRNETFDQIGFILRLLTTGTTYKLRNLISSGSFTTAAFTESRSIRYRVRT